MSTVTLIIGGIDISERVEKDTYSCIRRDYGGNSFTDSGGNIYNPRSGYRYELTITLRLIDREIYKLGRALDNDVIPVTFSEITSQDDSCITTADFMRPDEIGGSIIEETDDGDIWEMRLSLTSKAVAVSGSL